MLFTNDTLSPNDSSTAGEKLVVDEDLNIPPQSSVLIALLGSTPPKKTCFIYAIRCFRYWEGFSASICCADTPIWRHSNVCNQTTRPFSLLRGETVGSSIEPVDSIFSLNVSGNALSSQLNPPNSIDSTDTPTSDDVFQKHFASDLDPAQWKHLLAVIESWSLLLTASKPPRAECQRSPITLTQVPSCRCSSDPTMCRHRSIALLASVWMTFAHVASSDRLKAPGCHPRC